MTAIHTPLAYPFNSSQDLSLSEAYERARDTPGLLRVQLPYGEPAWLATRYADARLVLGDQRFSRALALEHDEPRSSEGRRDSGILSMDPPDHTRLRSLVAKAFTVRQVEKLRPQIRELTATLLDRMEAAGPPVDLVDRYALPIPVAVICRLLGVPEEDRPRFRTWSDAALSTSSLTAEEFDRNRDELRAYMAQLITAHRARPRDDLMTALIEARDHDDRLSELELVDLCVGILVAGHETTATQIPNFVLTLLDHPEALSRLRAEPTLITSAIEELLRFVPLGSGAGQPRYAKED
ncbi:cytochrome P450, partial [Streptomyces broussonetiae]